MNEKLFFIDKFYLIFMVGNNSTHESLNYVVMSSIDKPNIDFLFAIKTINDVTVSTNLTGKFSLI